MRILPYDLSAAKDLLTSRAGLICTAEVMESIGFSALIDRHFPKPQSNRGFRPSVFVNAVMLMLHEGGRCLDDLRHIREDKALRLVLGLKAIPQSDSLGNWLRRMGQEGVKGLRQVNKSLLKHALHTIKT